MFQGFELLSELLATTLPKNVCALRFNPSMENMYRSLSHYWSDSKRSQPTTPWGAAIQISSRFIIGALWFTGVTLVVTLYFVIQLAMVGIGAKK
tara:strand:- start:1715 stop:1996 length:282 start_codon:yes stop_codon:yes gene_type:complete